MQQHFYPISLDMMCLNLFPLKG